MLENQLVIGNVIHNCVNGAWIAEDAVIGKNVTIMPGAVVGRPPLSTGALARKQSITLPPVRIGDNCVIGCNAVIYRGTTIGSNCLIGDTASMREQVSIGDSCIIAMGVTINYNTKIGNRVKVMDNSHITGNVIIEDDVFISTLVSTTNDNSMGREAALNVPPEVRKRSGPIIRRNATIGAGASVLPGVEIGENAIVGANSTVTKAVPPKVLVMGTPARVIRPLLASEIKC